MSHRTERTTQAAQNLKLYSEILTELGIIHWLDGGTLLGAYRDKDYCLDDEDDTDICTWWHYHKHIDGIISKAEQAGFRLLHRWETEIVVEKDGLRIDLFFNKTARGDAFTYLYGMDKPLAVVIPAHFYELLEPIEFYGKTYNRPREVEEYLTLKYGDWRTPVHRSQYSCVNPSQNKLVRPDFNPND